MVFFISIFVDLILTDIWGVSISEFLWICIFAIFYHPKICFWCIKNKLNIVTFDDSDIFSLNDDKFQEWLCMVPQNCKEYWIEGRDKANWNKTSKKQQLSESFIREFSDKVDWEEISRHQQLSEDFIREFQDRVNWDCISGWQALSENFIREFQDKVNWKIISCQQKLSEPFIKEFQNKVDWEEISKYQVSSESFIKKFKNNLVE